MTSDAFPEPAATPGVGPSTTETTGNYLVLMAEDAIDEGVDALGSRAGIHVEAASDTDVITAEQLDESDHVLFPTLGVAIVKPEPDQVGALAVTSHEESSVLAIEPERVVYAIDELGIETEIESAIAPGTISPDYLRGYRDAIDGLLRSIGSAPAGELGAAALIDEGAATWGLQATKSDVSNFSGRGIRVAVLDTGIDLDHPDFAGRSIKHQSFIIGEAVQDRHSHGTHCIGTACGPLQPGRLPRFGVAYEAEIFAGKVLNNRGRGADGGILAGITWAIVNRCRIVSMSLGSAVDRGERPSRVFEAAARRAIRAGTVIIAAAGNDSTRPVGDVRPVGHPANCPSIMAVAALDNRLRIASFSNGGLNPNGGQVDIAGPGVRVWSSTPLPATYGTKSGTSMATPHVAGIAALHCQADPRITAHDLPSVLARTARRLTLPSVDVGAGLVQAP